MESSSIINSVTSEASSQSNEEVKKIEDQNYVQVLENYKLELIALTNEVAKMNLEIQDLKREKGNKKDKTQKKMKSSSSINQGATKDKGQKQIIRVSNDGNKCGLCNRLKTFDIHPKDHQHSLTKQGNPEPESCGHLRNKNVKEMAEFYRMYDMCRVCAYKPISSVHQEERCNYTTKVPQAKCRKCKLRYFLCDQHMAENQGQLQNRTDYFKRKNFPVAFGNLVSSNHKNRVNKQKMKQAKIDASTQTNENLSLKNNESTDCEDLSTTVDTVKAELERDNLLEAEIVGDSTMNETQLAGELEFEQETVDQSPTEDTIQTEVEAMDLSEVKVDSV